MTDDDRTLSCPRCGCPVRIEYDDPDDEHDHHICLEFGLGDAACPSCGLARCVGLDCWCLNADGTQPAELDTDA